MGIQNTETVDGEERHGSDETNRRSRAKRVLSAVARRDRNGTVAALAGGVLLASAIRRAMRGRRRTRMRALAGAALLGVGLRRRRSDDGMAADDGGEKTESAEARAHIEQSEVLHQSETNPRGVSGEPDVETETDTAEGGVQFTTEQDETAGSKPHLDGANEDPRRSERNPTADDDDGVEVDLSEASMADEASEATGPDTEQAYPTQEGTDPEPTPEEAPPRQGEGAVANTGPDDEPEADDGSDDDEA